MELKDLQITDDLWDFIEANVPNYHEREEVLRQAQLQLFIDGHESPVAGITREEAILLSRPSHAARRSRKLWRRNSIRYTAAKSCGNGSPKF